MAIVLISVVAFDRVANATVCNVHTYIVPYLLLGPLWEIPPFAARQVQDRVHRADSGGDEGGFDPVVQVLLLQRVDLAVECPVRVSAVVVMCGSIGLKVVRMRRGGPGLEPSARATSFVPIVAVAKPTFAEAFALCLRLV